MKCEKCGTEYEGNFCPKGCNSPYVKKKKPVFKKWWFWAIIAVVVIAIISSSGGKDDSTTDAPINNTEQSQTQNETSKEQTDTNETKNEYKVGDTIDANGFLITFEKAENYESSNMFLQPNEGMKYIRIYISAKKRFWLKRRKYNLYDFSLRKGKENNIITLGEMVRERR